MKLIEAIKEYQEQNKCFPGNDYWSKKFEDAFLADTERAVGLKNIVMPKIVEGRSKLIHIIANMVTGRTFPSSFIEDHNRKITRKYFQQVLTEYDDKIKYYANAIKQIIDSNFSA